ncbi:MAG: YgfZ/GcvT domain-containing protein [Lacipirellulaceae bacterium]
MNRDRWFTAPGDWSLLPVVGEDAGKFLQGFCTNDVQKLALGATCEAFFTDVKAHVLAYAWVTRREAGFDVLLGSPRTAELAAHLDRYLIRERVTLETTEAPVAVLVVQGATEVPPSLATAAIGGLGAECVVAYGDAGATGDFAAALASAGLAELTPNDWHATRILARQPLDWIDIDEHHLPQEVDRDAAAISFTKGCYLGQEPVARIDALGHVNRLLRVVRVTRVVEAGAELMHEGRAVGRVTSCAATPEGAVALAYVRRAHAAPGTPLTIGDTSAVVV